MDRSIGRLINWLIDGLIVIDSLIEGLILVLDWFIYWLVDWLIDWSWSIDNFVLAELLIIVISYSDFSDFSDWLVHWSVDFFLNLHTINRLACPNHTGMCVIRAEQKHGQKTETRKKKTKKRSNECIEQRPTAIGNYHTRNTDQLAGHRVLHAAVIRAITS